MVNLIHINTISEKALSELNREIIKCNLCPRLSNYIKEIGQSKVKRFINEDYWAKPLPSFGDTKAQLLIIGLAPAAHGGNRTGRMFTGDSSGQWVARALFETGFANKPTSQYKDDGLVLRDTYITATIRCAPPNNKASWFELFNCSKYLLAELKILEQTTRVVLTLGKVAFDAYCRANNCKGVVFKHGASYNIINGKKKTLLVSYHPSRQNTNTGKLTWDMWMNVFRTARSIIENK
jgi:uracil-DNA glycosylase